MGPLKARCVLTSDILKMSSSLYCYFIVKEGDQKINNILIAGAFVRVQ